MRATWGGNVEVAKVLLDKGADIKSKNDYDKTALDVAATFDKKEVLQILKNAELKQK